MPPLLALARSCWWARWELRSARIRGWSAGPGGGAYFRSRFAQAMKKLMFDRSSCPPSCWRQASSPSTRPVLTGGIFATR